MEELAARVDCAVVAAALAAPPPLCERCAAPRPCGCRQDRRLRKAFLYRLACADPALLRGRNVCGHVMKQKNRLCNFAPAPGLAYCREHDPAPRADDERVPRRAAWN